ncbi:MAG: hypothetical protein DME46_08545 [Verrucomicrobia bacterium]|nr:MAG: hypothetical protein DME46_08545 [Verrucomicrobiota bacterium]
MGATSIFFALILTSIVPAAIAQTGLNSLPEIEFSELTQRDPNPLGEKALSINPTQWKHGETEHYIYHFAHSYVATPISVEAEFHYRVVAKELERDQPLTDIKSNVYIFERPEDWQQFQGLGELEKWTGGIHSQGSLFIFRNPEQKFSGNVLGHEIVHLVLHRFYADGIPCWLNEGIAQYISKSAHASYQRARGYISKPHSEAIAAEEMIPLATLVRLTRPPSDRVETFYDESERLVRFLIATDKPSFLALLDALGRHQPFETSLPRIYPAKFATVATLEEKFREYAAKDFGTTLQQAEE